MRRELITAASVLALMSGVAYAQSSESTVAPDSAAQPQIMENQADSDMKAGTDLKADESAASSDVTIEDDTATTADSDLKADDAMKTDAMKSDDMKADDMKADSDLKVEDDSAAAPATGLSTPGASVSSDSSMTATTDSASAENMLGADVIGADGEDLGEVEDVILDQDGKAQQLIVSSGGFLGIGEKQVAVDFADATWNATEEQVQLSGITQDQIKDMADFEYSDTTTSLNRRMDETRSATPATPATPAAPAVND